MVNHVQAFVPHIFSRGDCVFSQWNDDDGSTGCVVWRWDVCLGDGDGSGADLVPDGKGVIYGYVRYISNY